MEVGPGYFFTRFHDAQLFLDRKSNRNSVRLINKVCSAQIGDNKISHQPGGLGTPYESVSEPD